MSTPDNGSATTTTTQAPADAGAASSTADAGDGRQLDSYAKEQIRKAAEKRDTWKRQAEEAQARLAEIKAAQQADADARAVEAERKGEIEKSLDHYKAKSASAEAELKDLRTRLQTFEAAAAERAAKYREEADAIKAALPESVVKSLPQMDAEAELAHVRTLAEAFKTATPKKTAIPPAHANAAGSDIVDQILTMQNPVQRKAAIGQLSKEQLDELVARAGGR